MTEVTLAKGRMILGLFIVVAFVFLAPNARVGYAEPSAAPRAASYDISWYTIDGGGTMDSTGGVVYALSDTIGQADAGTLNNGSYKLNGGFWGFLDSMTKLFLPLIDRKSVV
jgi:hypothetical protein